jgi:hypothetical protein
VSPARAQDRASTVLITVAAPASEAEQLEAVARELLSRLQMQVELRRVGRIAYSEIRRPLGPRQAYFARVWIAFTKSGRARLYLEHSERDRLLVRDVAPDSSNPELVREELGHILQTAIEGLKAGEEIGAPRAEAMQQVEEDEAPSPAVPPVATPEPEPEPAADRPEPSWERRRALRFGPRYEAVWLGDASAFEDGPGAALGWLAPKARWGLELLALYRRPLTIEAAPVGARTQTLGFRLQATFDAWRGERSLLRLGAGAGADLVRVSPRASAGSEIELAQSGWLSLALGRVSLSYARELAGVLDVELTLGADIDPVGTRYVFASSSGERNVLEPWPVRPLVSLGATVP